MRNRSLDYVEWEFSGVLPQFINRKIISSLSVSSLSNSLTVSSESILYDLVTGSSQVQVSGPRTREVR